MKYISTRNEKLKSSFEEAVVNGMPEDKGLYFPETIPRINEDFINNIDNYNNNEIAFEIASAYLSEDIPKEEIKNIVEKSLNFDIPLVELKDGLYSLELFHGPTLAFKDIGARFMSNCLNYFTKNRKVSIVVATSGDTGSAVANGFYGSENIDVFVLYPSGRVSNFQEKQFTTLGKNITAIEVKGSFDDCQKLVKQAFSDDKINEKLNLSTANSINIARLIPQIFYYFILYKQLKNRNRDLYISVPSGNYGNLCAGLIAKKMGLPVTKFVASSNINKIVPEYLVSGKFTPCASVTTISNAMDVGNPSNFERMLFLYKNHNNMTQDIVGESFSDSETKTTMIEVFKKYNYCVDPHGAIGYLGIKKHFSDSRNCVFLETAHYSKFLESINYLDTDEINIPERVNSMMPKEKKSIIINPDFEEFSKIMLKKHASNKVIFE